MPGSFDADPEDRRITRIFAQLGLLDDAAALLRPGAHVPRAGVLLAFPIRLAIGVPDGARTICGSSEPAFSGLQTSIRAFLTRAILRIKRPEAISEHSSEDPGRLLGLPRAPELRTLRRESVPTGSR